MGAALSGETGLPGGFEEGRSIQLRVDRAMICDAQSGNWAPPAKHSETVHGTLHCLLLPSASDGM
jgi:hypothetical protein